MARVPTIAEEDAKRPNRERGCLVGERTRIVNRMKGTLARLGIRNFKPTLRKAAERLATLHTPEGSALPPNVSAELQRNMARLGVVVSQIKEIEGARQKRLEQEPETEPHAMVRHLAVSPRATGSKASEYWVFCRLPLMSCQSYLPLPIVRAFGHRSRLGLSVAPPFGLGVPH
jgi:hypothetical protein